MTAQSPLQVVTALEGGRRCIIALVKVRMPVPDTL
jgi:hypothetical protein